MSCRSTPAGSALTTCARLATGNRVSDVIVLSSFHELRRNYENKSEADRKTYTRAEYDEFLEKQKRRVRENAVYTESQRNSLIRRLDAAASQPMPDQGTVYALKNITPRIRKRSDRLDQFLAEMATKFDLPVESIAQSFKDLEMSARGMHNPITYTKENRSLSYNYGLGLSHGAVHAVAVLTDQANAIENAEALSNPKRIIRQEIPENNQEAGIENLKVSEYGQDLRNGRLEVLILDSNGNQTEHVYTNIYEKISPEEIAKYWAKEIRGNGFYSYLSPASAEVAGHAPNCPTCGQFANSSHGCPIKVEPKTLRRFHTHTAWTPDWIPVPAYEEVQYKVELPSARELQKAMLVGAVTIESIHQLVPVDQEEYLVKGDLGIAQQGEELVFDYTKIRCTCSETAPCSHLNMMADLVKARLTDPIVSSRLPITLEERNFIIQSTLARISAPEGTVIESVLPTGRRDRTGSPRYIAAQARVAAAARRIEEILATDWTRHSDTLAEAMATWQRESELLYSENYDAFKADFDEAVRLRAANDGKPVIPYSRENVLNGLATRASGQGFGVELEYEFDDSVRDWDEANRQIGNALHAAGLTPRRSQVGYHSAASNGYTDVHTDANGRGTWSFEDDGSVQGGELVSPTMYDEPETWEKLEKAINILKEHGAVPTTHAGGHVHVGTGFYQGSPQKYTELARLMTQHEDVIYRLASDPDRGTHRGLGYTHPCPPVPANGFTMLREIHYAGRGALNYGNCRGESDDHSEFRVFDSTLDPGAVQAHIKMAVAMTHAAARVAETAPTQRPKEALGDHIRRARALRRTPEAEEHLEEDTTTLRSFLDTIFRRHEDKLQVTSIFANTKWTEGNNYDY